MIQITSSNVLSLHRCQVMRFSDASAVMMYRQKPLIMGVLNATPDSFSDGGRFLKRQDAAIRVERMIAEGADIIDVGGESSRPGATEVSCAEELARVLPVIECIRAISDICISIDTQKADVMKAAVLAGASFINDIHALQGRGALSVASQLDVPVCIMHMQGLPGFMQANPHYANSIIDEINHFFEQRIQACVDAGISRERLILDPGFGFGKSVEHNLSLMNGMAAFQRHGLPLLLGVSRKSTLGAITHASVGARGPAGIASAVFAALQGVRIIRTHDVGETNQALQMLDAIVRAHKDT